MLMFMILTYRSTKIIPSHLDHSWYIITQIYNTLQIYLIGPLSNWSNSDRFRYLFLWLCSAYDPQNLIGTQWQIPHHIFIENAVFKIHYISQVYNYSPLFAYLPAHYQKHLWIFSIVSEEPIVPGFDSNKLHQNHKRVIANIISTYLNRHNSYSWSNIQEIQAVYDQVKPIYG